MDRLSDVTRELQELQIGVDSTVDSFQGIEQNLEVCRSSTKEMVSQVLQAISGITESLPERRRSLDRVGFEIDRARAKIRELQTRAAKIGGTNLLSREKERLVELRHVLRDLYSDLECIKSFYENFQGRSARLKESE